MTPRSHRFPLASFRILPTVRALALAVALAAPLGATAVAPAQFGPGRSAPTPVSAEDFTRMITACGLADNVRDVALPLHETYFARFREFEAREITPALETLGGDFALLGSVDAAKEMRDARRRLLQRAAQLDGQLVDEIVGVLTVEDAVKAEHLREALSRRRSAAVLPNAGFMGRAETFDLRRSEAFARLDATARDAVAPTLDAYGNSLTRELERAADAALDRPVKAAELRVERNVSSTPALPAPAPAEDGGGDGGEGATGTPIVPDENWMRAMREIQRDAGADLAAVILRIRRLHRDTLAQIEPLLPAEAARAVRDDLIRAVYPMLRAKSDFDAALAEGKALRAKGEIDDARWSAAMAIVDAHDLGARGILGNLMDLADRDATDNDGIGFFVIDGGDAGPSDDAQRRRRLQQELADLSTRDAEALRAALGLAAPDPQVAGRGITVGEGGVDIGAAIAEAIGGGGEGGGAIQIQAVMVGGDGEAITLTSDDMDDAGVMFIGGLAGGGPRVPKPFTREELDAISAASGLDGAQRPTFDEIAARCAESRTAAEAEHGPQSGGIANADGSISLTFSIGGEGEMVAGGGDTEALVDAIVTGEETMFDELRAAATADRSEPIEAARRARARTRLALGETGEHSVDLLKIAQAVELGEAARASIDARLGEWDRSSVAALEAMRREIDAANERREEIMTAATEETTAQTEGGASIGRTVAIDDSMSMELAELDRRVTSARARVATANAATRAAIEDALAGDSAAQKTFRRAYLRAANPEVYRGARDLAPFFDKAAALEGVGEQGRADIARLKTEWIEAREARCEEFIRARDEAEREAKARASADAGGGAMSADTFRLMGVQQRERKRLREDLQQVEATIFRRLQDLLIVEVGADRAKEIGELPARRRANMPSIRIGG